MASQAGVGGIEELIDEKVRRSGEKISRQDAEDEVIADAMETMLGSSEAVKQLYAQNATLADQVLSWLADFMRVVKAAIGPADHREAQIIDSVVELYASLLGNNLGRLLEAVNIEQIVVDKINGLDAAQLETTIFGIMKRELRAIVYLGAVLGFLMGFINLLI